VTAAIFEVSVNLAVAKDILYRREIHADPSSTKRYVEPEAGSTKAVRISELHDFAGFDVTIYTDLAATIEPLTAENLAKLARSSVGKAKAGMDGISPASIPLSAPPASLRRKR
jgi:hypothetical protein